MNVTFLNQPKLETHAEDEWLLVDPFDVRIDVDGQLPIFVTVPAGFATDLASVPRLPGAYLLFGGRARRSAILHDYLYVTRWDRKFADNAFLAAMRAEGVGAFTRWAMWLGVRVGGANYYAEYNQPEKTP